MKFLKKLIGRREVQKEETVTIVSFWKWFIENQDRFFRTVKNQNMIQFEFVDPVFKKLEQIRKDTYLLTGMMNESKAELIFTAEGNIRNFPFIKDLVEAAPKLDNWQFTAFKPAMDYPDFGIDMGSRSFSTENVCFHPLVDEDCPDEISIILSYTDDYDEDENDLIENGVFVFVENYLGEIKTATQIDKLSVDHNVSEDIELNPIYKLADYINWREKEFTEKYEGTVHDSDNSNYSSLEWNKDTNPIVGVCNSDLIRWDKKASHPWVMVITINYNKVENNGMPSNESLQKYYQFEDRLRELLPDKDGYVHVAQTTGVGEREIYYVNKDFYKPVKVLESMRASVGFTYEFEIYKDKYWKSMSQFVH